jgi:hypothetical protein
MRNIGPINGWMNEFNVPETNEWHKKSTLALTTPANKKNLMYNYHAR